MSLDEFCVVIKDFWLNIYCILEWVYIVFLCFE